MRRLQVVLALAVAATLVVASGAFASGTASVGVVNAGSRTVVNAPDARSVGPFGAVYVHAPYGGARSWDAPSKRAAERAAYDTCIASYGTCQGVFWVSGSECGAVGWNTTGTKIYYAFASSVRGAARKILARWPSAYVLGGTCGNRK